MNELNPPVRDTSDIDPALVKAMRSRVITRKSQPNANRKAGPDRPKGSVKVPGSGKQAGTSNLMSPEFRQWLYDRAKPFELLADICAGKAIQDGDTKRKPTVAERMRAAETRARTLLPDRAVTTISARTCGPVIVEAEMPPREIARRLAFMLTRAAEDPPARPAPHYGEPEQDRTTHPSRADHHSGLLSLLSTISTHGTVLLDGLAVVF